MKNGSMLPNQILNRIIGLQEDERREYYRHFNMERRIMREDSDPFTLSNSLFKDLFRLNKEMVHFLLLNLSPHMQNRALARTKTQNFCSTLFFCNWIIPENNWSELEPLIISTECIEMY
ncbi:hypothetical protein NQ314_016150 [Rhamnusium bicolor]|uniref:Uncharacterized protein n=1 Tax=Rhamnusium bicolor TaxID=1586634 RepID=A0AAV8WXZ0_9CUCU|nr:hypothetical protein NQ314_016150 [Rhamnusium bicolor]